MPHLDGIFQLIEYLSPVSSALPGHHHIGVRAWFTGLGYYFTTREDSLIKSHFFSMRRRNFRLSASICGALAIGCTVPGLPSGKMAHLIKK
ncbi:MAG: hypothetical protein JRJ27_17920 [Deltaproteobacteria bacterium]|nr:hypothetical protein [Deltaproteobacteria bacterium]